MRKLIMCTMVLILVFVFVSSVAAVEKYPTDYIIQHASDLANKSVTVTGVVSNSQAVTPDPMSDVEIKGEFDITDKSGVIHIKTPGDPPANGIKLSVSGVVDASSDPPMIVQSGGAGQGILLYAALGVLVVLAIILILMLVRKPQRIKPVDPPTSPKDRLQPPPPVKREISCPRCGSKNDGDANYCEHCREQIRGGTISSSRPKPPTDNGGTIPPRPPVPMTADLTIVETTGKQINARFELSNDSKGLKIGRDAEMGIHIDDETVSKEHARIWWSEDDRSFYIQDDNSTWGTVVNGQKVSRVALKDNDELVLGKTKLIFRLVGAQLSGDRTIPPPSV